MLSGPSGIQWMRNRSLTKWETLEEVNTKEAAYIKDIKGLLPATRSISNFHHKHQNLKVYNGHKRLQRVPYRTLLLNELGVFPFILSNTHASGQSPPFAVCYFVSFSLLSLLPQNKNLRARDRALNFCNNLSSILKNILASKYSKKKKNIEEQELHKRYFKKNLRIIEWATFVERRTCDHGERSIPAPWWILHPFSPPVGGSSKMILEKSLTPQVLGYKQTTKLMRWDD